MRILILSILALNLTVVSSCGNRKKNKKDHLSEAINNMYTTANGSKVWVKLVELNDKIPTDPFNLIDVHIDDMNKLHLTLEYSGGCEPHEFEIIGSKAILKSFPAQRPVMIVHKANGDACRSIIREEIVVDISDFAYTKEHDSEIILLLDGQRLSYKYQDLSKNKQ
jgi:hypothetical protein